MSGSANPPPGGGGHHFDKEPPNHRFSNLIHDSEVFLTKLREFKPQSLGCLEARRKSSSTLIFPSPQQACMGPPKCPRYPHSVKPTPGYWIECHGPGVLAEGGKSLLLSSSSAAAAAAAASSDHQHQHRNAGDELGGGLKVSGPSSSISEHQKLDSHQTPSNSDQHQQPAAGEHAEGQLIEFATVTTKRRQSVGEKPTLSNSDKEEAAAATTLSGLEGNFNLPEASEQVQTQTSKSAAHTTSTSTASGGGGGAKGDVNQTQTRKQSTRRRLHKRTMTRDDIDLHKSRRGTPNITITEPSFNQSIVLAQQAAVAAAATADKRAAAVHQVERQSSQGAGDLRRLDSSESAQSTESQQQQQQQPLQRQPIKFQIQRYMSIEAQQSKDEASSSLPRIGGREFTIESEEASAKSDESPETPATTTTTTTTTAAAAAMVAAAASAYHQQRVQPYHRPSVIREDVDNEMNLEHLQQQSSPLSATQYAQDAQDLASKQFGSTFASSTTSRQNATLDGGDDGGGGGGQLYCGLSTSDFNKRPYQQAHSDHHQQQQQQNFEQFRDSSLELISFEEENYEKHYYGREHWNYFTNDELLGPVMLSLKQEVNNQRDHFHVLLRTVSYTLHGTIPASTICADRYDREAIVRELSEIAKLKPPLMPGQLPSTPDELLKLDHIFIKTELKVGVIYIKAGQEESEEAILGNKEESPLFTEFLDLLGDRITLKGFDRYKGGLDTVHNLTGISSVYTMWRNIEIMFHVSTMLPHEENDPQKLQKKRHIGNDIVCVAFIESDDTLFWPGCIKSYFLHTFIAVRTSPKPVPAGEKRKYYVSCVCRNEVQYAFRPYLVEQDNFYKSDYFREWLLVKIVNGERASYSAPKFARMQDRTRSQLLEDIITNLANHLVTGQIPKPYRRGSWRPLGHTRASSPLEDSMKDYFEDYEQLAKDFSNAFCGPSKSVLCDVAFRVKDADGSYKLVHGVRAILAIRSRTFLEMLYGFVPPGTGPSGLQSQTNLRAIELKALGEPSGLGAKGELEQQHQHQSKSMLTKRGSVGADPSKKLGEKERRQSMLPNLSKTISQKPNYLTVPNTGGGAGAGSGGGGGGSAGGMIKNAFNRLVSGNWSGWSGNIKGYKGEPMHIKVDQNKTKVDLNSLAICKEIAKIDADKLTQREFEIKEFDYETFKQTIEYIHNGQCKLNYETIPGLICAAEHYDLPDLLHACFHHANTHMKLSAAPKMMNALYQNSCFYITAMQLLDAIYDYIDPHGNEFFNRSEYLELYESVFTSLLCRKTLQVSELKRFQAMDGWARQQVANKQQRQLLQRKQSSEQREQQQQQAQSTGDNVIEQQQQQQPMQQQQQQPIQPEVKVMSRDEAEQEYRNLINRLNKDVNIKLDKISSEDLVKIVLPTKVFPNNKIFEVMADESRDDY